MGRSFCYKCQDYIIPIQLKGKKTKMTFEEYIAMLNKFLAENPEVAHMQVVDSRDEMPGTPEIIEGNVVIADTF
jgi:hypothetical protein